MNKGKLIAVSAASGAGKTTVCRELLKRNRLLDISISATSRNSRGDEKDGVEYFFLTKKQFEEKIKTDEFLEWEEVHGNYYGTLKSQVEAKLNSGYSVLLDIDVLGALNIKKKFPESILIFIKAPSLEILRQRLIDRKTESPEDIEKRMARVKFEYEKAKYFDHSIVNDQIQDTLQEIEMIIKES